MSAASPPILDPERPIPTQIPRRVRSWGGQFRFYQQTLGVLGSLCVGSALWWLWSHPTEITSHPAGTLAYILGTFSCFLLWPMIIAAVWLGSYLRLKRVIGYGRVEVARVVRVLETPKGARQVDYTWQGRASTPQRARTWIGPGPGVSRFEADVPFALLVDPRRPERAVVPQFNRVELVEIADERPEQVVPPPVREPHTAPQVYPLWDTPELTAVDAFVRLFGLKGPGRCGELHMDEQGVRLSASETRARIEWGRPFVVQLSFWLASAGRGELGVRLRQVGAEIDAPSLEVRVVLPQARLSRSLPAQDTRGAYLEAADFEVFWENVRYYAALQGVVIPPWVA